MNDYKLPFLATVVLLSLASCVSWPDHLVVRATVPIFDGGRLRANVEITGSDAKVQYLAWQQSVLTAIEDVENGLSSVHRDTQTVQVLRAQVKTTQETLALSIGSYKDGQLSLLDVLDAQRSVATSQANLAQAVQQMAKDYVTLNVAIGSGYNFGGPRSGQILMNTEPHAVAAMIRDGLFPTTRHSVGSHKWVPCLTI
jgi:multidrug efflux system outer membrane protein